MDSNKKEMATLDILKRQLEEHKRNLRGKSEIKVDQNEIFMSHETQIMKTAVEKNQDVLEELICQKKEMCHYIEGLRQQDSGMADQALQ